MSISTCLILIFNFIIIIQVKILCTCMYLAIVIRVGFGRDCNTVAIETMRLSIISKELT